MKAILGLLVTSLAIATPVTNRVSYDGYKVVRLSVGNDVAEVDNLISDLSLATWQGHGNGGTHVDVVVPPEQQEQFDTLSAAFEPTVMHNNLGVSIAEEEQFGVYAANISWFNAYHAYADHLQFLTDLATQYPSNAEVITSGSSTSGRAITGLHIYGSGGKNSKPAIVFHGTVHAREWITTMVVEYIAYQLLTGYASDTTLKSFVDKYDFYLFPVVNPDGFVYTQTTNRLWRKNRLAGSGSSCVGTDINRNWPYQWTGSGSSTNPCAEDYRGTASGSTAEVNALVDFLESKSSQGVKLYIDWHSYSQLFMTPYGYSCSARATNNAKLQSLAAGYVSALKAVYGTSYEYGPICSTIYQTNGDSVDWAQDVLKAENVFTAELRDTGTYGFVLPPAQILPTSVETFAGLKYLLANL